MQLPPEAVQQWQNLQKLMQARHHEAAVQEAGTLLQTVLRMILLEYTSKLPYANRSALLRLEQELGKGSRGIEAFELGPLVQIITSKEVDFNRCAASLVKKDAEILKAINPGYLQSIRNKHAHYSATALRAAAQYFVSSIEILFCFFEIDVLNYAGLLAELEELKSENRLLKTDIGSIEEINGIIPVYRRYAEISDGMDYIDTCWFAGRNQLSTPELKELYDRAHYTSSATRETRIVINLHNQEAAAFVLFYRFVKDYEFLKTGKFRYRGFHAFSDREGYVHLPHFVLIYSRNNMDNGFVFLSSFDDETRQQRNIIVKGRKFFGLFFESYRMLWNSCKALSVDDLKNWYLAQYGAPSKVSDIEEKIELFYDKLVMTSERNAAIDLWRSILGV